MFKQHNKPLSRLPAAQLCVPSSLPADSSICNIVQHLQKYLWRGDCILKNPERKTSLFNVNKITERSM